MARINVFENIPNLQILALLNGPAVGSLNIHQVFIPGSLSFNNVAIVMTGSGAVSEDASLYFGLYSLNGASLSLANSASAATGLTLNQTMRSWITFATSATQDITPGNWYFAFMSSTSLGGGFTYYANSATSIGGATYGGPFLWGRASATQSDMPASIATSDLDKDTDTITSNVHPYIVISA